MEYLVTTAVPWILLGATLLALGAIVEAFRGGIRQARLTKEEFKVICLLGRK